MLLLLVSEPGIPIVKSAYLCFNSQCLHPQQRKHCLEFTSSSSITLREGEQTDCLRNSNATMAHWSVPHPKSTVSLAYPAHQQSALDADAYFCFASAQHSSFKLKEITAAAAVQAATTDRKNKAELQVRSSHQT